MKLHASMVMIWAAFLLSVSGCQGPEERRPQASPAASQAEHPPLLTRDGALRLHWRSLPHPVPIGEDFLLELEVLRVKPPHEAVLGAQIHLQGFMPDHGHGMVRDPRSQEVGAGVYRIPAVLLHMEGHWEMSFTIVSAGLAHTADFVLDL